MEERRPIMWKPLMNIGAILAAGLILPNLVLYLMGKTFDLYNVNILLQIVIVVLGILYGGRYIRDNFFGGYIEYGRILGMSILILLFASFIYAFYKYMLFGFIDPDLMTEYFQFMEDKVLEAQDSFLQLGMSESDVEKYTAPMLNNMDEIREETTAISLAQSEIFNITFWGGLLSLILCIFIKKKKNIFDQ
jgi:Protein of unknown function (DUF4199)